MSRWRDYGLVAIGQLAKRISRGPDPSALTITIVKNEIVHGSDEAA
jgi:hypothetical protein